MVRANSATGYASVIGCLVMNVSYAWIVHPRHVVTINQYLEMLPSNYWRYMMTDNDCVDMNMSPA